MEPELNVPMPTLSISEPLRGPSGVWGCFGVPGLKVAHNRIYGKAWRPLRGKPSAAYCSLCQRCFLLPRGNASREAAREGPTVSRCSATKRGFGFISVVGLGLGSAIQDDPGLGLRLKHRLQELRPPTGV